MENPFDIDWDKHEDFFSSPFGPIHNRSAQNAAQSGKSNASLLMDAWKEISKYMGSGNIESLTSKTKGNKG
jgi:hypothetical protein